MAARPFRLVGKLPRPLTVEETAAKFGVSMAVVDAARRVLMNRSGAGASGAGAGRFATTTRTRKAASRKRLAR